MDRRVKERLVGALVLLVLLSVIFVPLIRDDSRVRETAPAAAPPRPDHEFSTRLIPMPERGDILPAEQEETTPAIPPAAGAGDAPAVDATDAGAAPAQVEEAAPAARPEPSAETRTARAAPAAQPAEKKPAESPPPAARLTGWVVQVGSFSRENATKVNERLRRGGYRSYIVDQPVTSPDGTQVYRVRVGPEALRSQANTLRARLQQDLQLDGIVLEYP